MVYGVGTSQIQGKLRSDVFEEQSIILTGSIQAKKQKFLISDKGDRINLE